MNRYHVKVYIPQNDKFELGIFTEIIDNMSWRYTTHTLDNLKYRTIDIKSVLYCIKMYILNTDDIFEYYKDDAGNIIKVCYRIHYTAGTDLILVISDKKEIITIYTNERNDDHITLNKNLYVKD